jgi:hypothetical protein
VSLPFSKSNFFARNDCERIFSRPKCKPFAKRGWGKAQTGVLTMVLTKVVSERNNNLQTPLEKLEYNHRTFYLKE